MDVENLGPKDWAGLFEARLHLEEKIIQSLDLESALSCRLVCQSWRDTISDDRKLKTRIRQTSILKAVRMGPLSTNVVAKFNDVNKICKSGWTPLGFAAQSGNTKVVQTLLTHGADVNKLDQIFYQGGNYRGLPPLFHAVMKGHTSMVKLLVKNGADVAQKVVSWVDGKYAPLTAMHIARTKHFNIKMQKLLKRMSKKHLKQWSIASLGETRLVLRADVAQRVVSFNGKSTPTAYCIARKKRDAIIVEMQKLLKRTSTKHLKQGSKGKKSNVTLPCK